MADAKTPPKRKTRPPFRRWPEKLICDRRVPFAYHEAGHTLAHLYLGHTVRRLALRTTVEVAEALDRLPADNEAWVAVQAGCVEASGPPHFVQVSRPEAEARLRGNGLGGAELDLCMRRAGVWVEMDLITLLAGPVAQGLYERRPLDAVLKDEASRGDSRKVQRLLDGWFDAAEHGHIHEEMAGRAEALVSSFRGRKFVEAVAVALLVLGEVDGKAATELFEMRYGSPAPTWADWEPYWMEQAPSRAEVREGRLPPPLTEFMAAEDEMADANGLPA